MKKHIRQIAVILCVVTGGLALVNALLGWIGGTGSNFSFGLTSSAPADYILGSILVAIAATCLIVFSILVGFVKCLDRPWMLFILIACAALTSVYFANLAQHILVVATIAALIGESVTTTKEEAPAPKKEAPKK